MTSAKTEQFMRVYTEIQQFLLEDMNAKYEMDPDRLRYLKFMMDTTCLGGKYNRGITVVDVAEAMSTGANHDEATRERVLHDACVAGWLIEFLQAHYLVEDDIMDSSKTRRGKPCWYRFPGVTTQSAINDGIILKCWTEVIAMHYFSERPFFSQLLCNFHSVDYTTSIGQFYDITSMYDSSKLNPEVAQPPTTDYAEFTLPNYKRIVKYKTAFYTYFLPLLMGLLVSETESSVDMDLLKRTALLMGEYFQVQDDVLDCFAPPEELGKIGTDIEDAKCSWLAATFLGIAKPEQVEEFKANYGNRDPEKVAIIKRLYNEVNLKEEFDKYEAQVATECDELIKKITLSSATFGKSVSTLWGKTFKRQK